MLQNTNSAYLKIILVFSTKTGVYNCNRPRGPYIQVRPPDSERDYLQKIEPIARNERSIDCPVVK